MSEKVEVINCRIRETFLGREDHGIFTFYLSIERGDGGVQGFGGFGLDEHVQGGPRRARTYALEVIIGILRALGVDSWEKVKGQYCRIKFINGVPEEITHIMEDRWFCPRDVVKLLD